MEMIFNNIEDDGENVVVQQSSIISLLSEYHQVVLQQNNRLIGLPNIICIKREQLS